MPDQLVSFRRLCTTPADAVRWACTLEVIAPKAGNVHPGCCFEDLTVEHFLIAAEIAARQLGDSSQSFSQRVLTAVTETRRATGTNVNLGILLLLGPLVAADELDPSNNWTDSIAGVLAGIQPAQSRDLFQAIALSSAGGLGEVDSMDVSDSSSHDDILAAMRLAQTYDRIARQYADGFTDLRDNILPILYDSTCEFTDLLRAISVAHIRLLASSPDSLIARKNGSAVALSVQADAAKVDVHDADACLRFDQRLRGSGNQLNPGTTADLIAAALYILLRTRN
jgi:triphosphoribosyl-dephospho-CoA synthase